MTEVRKSGFLWTIPLLITICIFTFPSYAKYGGGNGTADDPYQIASAEDLILLGDSPEDYDKHFIMTADIDLDPNLPGRKVFDKAVIAPDTDRTKSDLQGIPFAGVFNGDGNTISNLTIKGGGYVGLFCRAASGSQIENLGLIDVNINDSSELVGGLVAWNEGDVRDCYSIGTVGGSGWAVNVGGLVGWNQSGNIIRCYSSGVVTGEWTIGGLVGKNESNLTNCYSSSTIISSIESSGRFSEAFWGAGGLVGRNDWRGTVTHCYTTGDVSGHNYVGGFIGYNDGVLTACYSIGAVSGKDCVGGLVGSNQGVVIRCFSTGTVSGKYFVGGLVGLNYEQGLTKLSGCTLGDVINSYSIGLVSGTGSYVGGLAARNSGGEITGCFWDTQTSGQTTSAGGMGLTTSEMQTAETFLEAGWDFVSEIENGTYDIWRIDEGQGYPKLIEFSEDLQLQPFPAFCPYPQDGAIDIGPLLILRWAKVGSFLYHDVYLGEDKQAVTNATTKSPDIYRGRQAAGLRTYDLGTLELNKTYYWRIDEVDEADPNNPWKGNVWSFTTANFLIIDDFESYNDLDEGEPNSNRIYLTWVDGYDTPEINGSIVGYTVGWGILEHRIVHGGLASMPYFYDNAVGISEATASMDNLEIDPDWTLEGVRVLSLWFRGISANAPEPMYVALANDNGTNGVSYNDNPDAAQIEKWTEWRIDLHEFKTQGVDLSNIDTISIGFGNKNNPQAGGEGHVKFDDIRLYRQDEGAEP